MPGFDVILELFVSLGRQGAVLVPPGQIAHAGLVRFIESKSQDVSRELAGQVRIIGPDEASENRDFARCVCVYSRPVATRMPPVSSRDLHIGSILRPHATIQRPIPDGLGDVLGLDIVGPSRSAIVRATRKTLSWARAERPSSSMAAFNEAHGFGLEGAELADLARGHPAVDQRALGAEALGLAGARLEHLGAEVRRGGPGGISASWVKGTAGTSTWRSMRSSRGPEILLRYFSTWGGVQLQARRGSER